MQKVLAIVAFILLSSLTVAAQTADEQVKLSDGQRVEFAKRVETERTINAPASLTAEVVDGRVLRIGPTTTYLKNGLSKDEVVRILGKPSFVLERWEGKRFLATYTFKRSSGRLFVAEFEDGLLVRSRTEPAASPEPGEEER